MNAPTPNPLGYGVQPGTDSQVLLARQVIVFGPNDGIFVYNGTPALGNLIWADVPATGLDPFGNVVFQGSFSYVPSGTALASFVSGLNFGNLYIGTGSGMALVGGSQPSTVSSGGDGITSYDSGLTNGTDQSSSITLKSANNTGTIPIAEVNGGVGYLADGTPNPAAISFPVHYADAAGNIRVSANDGTNYATERNTQYLTANTASLTGLTSILTIKSSAQTYRVHAQLYLNVAVANAQFEANLIGQAGATGEFGFVVSRAATFFGSIASPANTAGGLAVNLPAANGFVVQLDGLITLTAAGTLNIQVGSLTAQGVVVAAGSFADFMPV
jgi:hypothetical protein